MGEISIAVTTECLYHYRQRKGSILHTLSVSNTVNQWQAGYDRYTKMNAFEVEHNFSCSVIRYCLDAISHIRITLGNENASLDNYPTEREQIRAFIARHYHDVMQGDDDYGRRFKFIICIARAETRLSYKAMRMGFRLLVKYQNFNTKQYELYP